MPRVVNEVEYAARRNDILDVAQRYIYTKGYEQMSIQDILDDMNISKGAFYHYFDSKGALLEALIERMMNGVEQLLMPIVDDPHSMAIEKLNTFFHTASMWKISQREAMMALMAVWYADDNAITRDKMKRMTMHWITPMLTKIIHQGVQEGVFNTAYTDQISGVILAMEQGLGESMAQLLLHPGENENTLQCGKSLVDAFTDALEKILGAPSHSITLLDFDTLSSWFSNPWDGHQVNIR